ncbi:hypothetical protein [Paraburkholderia sp. J63]|uniref:hypothetical protein n=1 Tax=Paraburkholderia sp. J63 TaxID=2805434 RepID=UPI002ABE1751|nr:hypothetical protein [Paraburkholderia sp. J63]
MRKTGTHARMRLVRWVERKFWPASRAAVRGAGAWLLYIWAASQMADPGGLPIDETTIERYLGTDCRHD